MQVVTFTELRDHLKEIMDTSADRYEPVVIRRAKGENMVLRSLESYESLKETAYLFSDKANAEHLRRSIRSLEAHNVAEKKLLGK